MNQPRNGNGNGNGHVSIRTILAWAVAGLTTAAIGYSVGVALNTRTIDRASEQAIEQRVGSVSTRVEVILERLNSVSAREAEHYANLLQQYNQLERRLNDLEAEFRRFVR